MAHAPDVREGRDEDDGRRLRAKEEGRGLGGRRRRHDAGVEEGVVGKGDSSPQRSGGERVQLRCPAENDRITRGDHRIRRVVVGMSVGVEAQGPREVLAVSLEGVNGDFVLAPRHGDRQLGAADVDRERNPEGVPLDRGAEGFEAREAVEL